MKGFKDIRNLEIIWKIERKYIVLALVFNPNRIVLEFDRR